MRATSDITDAVGKLLAAAPTGSKVILFGSHARGDARPDSDVDLMVVQPRVTRRIEETARLDRVLRGIRTPIDLLVVSASVFEHWKNTPNTAIHAAAREGRVFE